MDTKDKIRRTALTLFVKQGYESTSLADIAAGVGVTKPAIYYHFESKDDLLRSILTAFLDQAEQMLLEDTAQVETIAQLLEAMFGRFLNLDETLNTMMGQMDIEGYELYYYVLIFNGLKKFPDVEARVHQFYHRSLQTVVAYITQEQAQGTMRPDLEAEALALEWFATLDGLYLHNLFNPHIDLPTVSQSIVGNILRSIQNESPPQG